MKTLKMTLVLVFCFCWIQASFAQQEKFSNDKKAGIYLNRKSPYPLPDYFLPNAGHESFIVGNRSNQVFRQDLHEQFMNLRSQQSPGRSKNFHQKAERLRKPHLQEFENDFNPGFRQNSSMSDNVQEAWVRHFSSGLMPGYHDVNDLKIDDQGNIYVTGSSHGAGFNQDYATVKYNASGAQQWVARYNGLGNSEDIATALSV